MPNAAATVEDARRSIALLEALGDPAAARLATALERWLAGESFDRAAGLLPGWRAYARTAARDQALEALTALRPDLDDAKLARFIVDGMERVAAVGGNRPDGAAGYCHDLVRAGVKTLSFGRWRHLIAEFRG